MAQIFEKATILEMLIPRMLILSSFLLFFAAISGLGSGRAPKNPASAWPPVFAKRVFLRALPAGGTGYYVVWNARHKAGRASAGSAADTSETAEGLSLFAERFGLDDSAQWPVPGFEIAHGLPDPGGWEAFPDGQGGLIVAAIEKNRLMIRRVNPEGKVLWDRLDQGIDPTISEKPNP